jgi:hypothetical protein
MTFLRRHSLFMCRLWLLRRLWHLIMPLLGTSWRRLWLVRHMRRLVMPLPSTSCRRLWLVRHMRCLVMRPCSVRAGEGCGMWWLGFGEECGNLGVWSSRASEYTSLSSTTLSKCTSLGVGEQAVYTMSFLCQRMNWFMTSHSKSSPSGVGCSIFHFMN